VCVIINSKFKVLKKERVHSPVLKTIEWLRVCLLANRKVPQMGGHNVVWLSFDVKTHMNRKIKNTRFG